MTAPFLREPDAVYHGEHAKTYFGSSLAKAALISPRLVADRRAAPTKITPAMRRGSVWDAIMSYGPILALSHIVVLPEGATAKNKEGKALIEQANAAGKPWCDQAEAATFMQAHARMPLDLKVRSDAWSAHELTQLSARSVIAGVPMQMRADALAADAIVDFKFSGVSLEGWPAHSIKMGYHIQAGWYRMIAKHLTGHDYDFQFLVTESKPPHRTALFKPDTDWLAFGDSRAEDAHGIIARCLETGRWDDRSDSERTMALPAWAATATVTENDDGSLDLEG